MAPAKLTWLVDTDWAHWIPEPSRASTIALELAFDAEGRKIKI
jgi:hypothetical protein